MKAFRLLFAAACTVFLSAATAAAADLENTLYMDLKDGRVVIELRPDLAPKHVARVKELTGSDSTIQYIPYDDAYEAGFEDMPRRVPDISKICGLIGYRPKLELDEIIRTVIEHIRQK